jgi:hypothetical protein
VFQTVCVRLSGRALLTGMAWVCDVDGAAVVMHLQGLVAVQVQHHTNKQHIALPASADPRCGLGCAAGQHEP